MVLARVFDVVTPAALAKDELACSGHERSRPGQHLGYALEHRASIARLALGQVLRLCSRVAQVALVIELLRQLRGVLRVPAEPFGAATRERVLGEQLGRGATHILLLDAERAGPRSSSIADCARDSPVENLVLGRMPKRDLGPALSRDHEGDLVEVLRDEVADALLEISQDGERGRLHPAKAPGLPKGRWSQPQGDGAGSVQTQVVVLVLPAQRLQIRRIVAPAGGGLLGNGVEGPADVGLVEGAELEAVPPPLVAEVLERLPSDHRALP